MARVILLRILLSETTFYILLSKLAKQVKINFQYQVFAVTEALLHKYADGIHCLNPA